MSEEVKAREHLVHPHQRAASKPRQEGFEPNEEEVREFAVSSSEHKSGTSAVHRDSRNRATRKEKQSGVRHFSMLFKHIFSLILIFCM